MTGRPRRMKPADLVVMGAQGELIPAPRKRRPPQKANHAFFARLCETNGLPRPVWEYRFHPTRMFRADFAWPEYRVILELDGGIFSKGVKQAHGAINQMLADRNRDNETQLIGWMVLRIPFSVYLDASTFNLLKRALIPARLRKTEEVR